MSIEESVDLEVSEEYSHEVNGQVTIGATSTIEGKFFGIGAKYDLTTEVSAGYSHTWTNGHSRTTGKATAASTGTSLDKSMESESGVAGIFCVH